jgi:hypothetical protein
MEKAEARDASRRKREAKGTEAPTAAPQKSTPDYPDANELLQQTEPEVPKPASQPADVFSAFKTTPVEKKPEDESDVNLGSVWPASEDAKPSDS